MALFTIEIKELHLHVDLKSVDKKADKIISEILNLTKEMARTRQEFKDLAQEVKTAFANIADDITRLTGELQRKDLTEQEEEEVFIEFRELADQANILAGRTPEAPVEPPVEG